MANCPPIYICIQLKRIYIYITSFRIINQKVTISQGYHYSWTLVRPTIYSYFNWEKNVGAKYIQKRPRLLFFWLCGLPLKWLKTSRKNPFINVNSTPISECRMRIEYSLPQLGTHKPQHQHFYFL